MAVEDDDLGILDLFLPGMAMKEAGSPVMGRGGNK